jgi:hypothetical protein
MGIVFYNSAKEAGMPIKEIISRVSILFLMLFLSAVFRYN